MKSCLDELNSIKSQYEEFFESLESRAHSALRKLGLDPRNWSGVARFNITCKKGGSPCYLTLVVHEGFTRRKVSLGRVEKFKKPEQVLEKLYEKFGITREELQALLLYRYQKNLRYEFDKLKYHIDRVKQIANSISIDEFLRQYTLENEIIKVVEKPAVPRW